MHKKLRTNTTCNTLILTNLLIMKNHLLLVMFLISFGTISSFAAVGDKYEAEAYNNNSGAKSETNADLSGGGNVGYIKNSTWIMFSGVNFSGDETRVEVTAAGEVGGAVEIRTGASDGTLIGTATILPTAGWGDYQTFKANIATQTGLQDLYFVFTGGDGYLFNVDYFALAAEVASYTLTTAANPVDAGMVSTNLDGPKYDLGTTVTLTATNKLGFVFDHWEDASNANISSDNPLAVVIASDTTLTAMFTTVDTYSLGIFIEHGSINASPALDTVASVLMYNAGADVKLTASPFYGYTFVDWNDVAENQISTDSVFNVTMSQDKLLTAATQKVTDYALPSWTFDNDYTLTDTGNYVYIDPNYLDAKEGTSFGDGWVFPNNITTGNSVGLTASATSITTVDVRGAVSCRITWSGANEVADVTDSLLHNEYYQFQFPTIGFKTIGLNFTFSGGQSNAADNLALVYSVDSGKTWIDGGSYAAGDHWSKFLNYKPSLIGAEDNELVIVRLLCISASTSTSNNFNLDQFSVTGEMLPPSDPTIVGHWTFDNDIDSLIVDDNFQSDGMAIDTVEHVEGYAGEAISFQNLSDTSYIKVADSDLVNLDSSSFSISAIVKFDVNANAGSEFQVVFKGGTAHQTIVGKGDGVTWETFGKWFTLAFKGGELRFAIDDDSNKTQLGIDVSTYFPADKWVHIVGVRDMDEDSLKLYLNGVQIASMPDATNTNINTSGIPLIIGNNKDQNNSFNGGIDELMIKNHALTAAEVVELSKSYGLDNFPLKDNANITGISVNATAIQPFMGLIKSYDVKLPKGTTTIDVQVTKSDADATVDIVTNADSSVIVITAEDGVTENIFKVYYTYESGVGVNQNLRRTMVVFSGAQLLVSSDVSMERVEVFEMSGNLILSVEAIGKQATIPVNSDRQLFVVRVTTVDGSKTLKVSK